MWKEGANSRGSKETSSTGGVEKTGALSTGAGKKKSYPQKGGHIPQISVDNFPSSARGIGGPLYSYRMLMLAVMSLMISAFSGSVLIRSSTRSMEWSTVVWSRPSNSLPISFRDRLVIRRI